MAMGEVFLVGKSCKKTKKNICPPSRFPKPSSEPCWANSGPWALCFTPCFAVYLGNHQNKSKCRKHFKITVQIIACRLKIFFYKDFVHTPPTVLQSSCTAVYPRQQHWHPWHREMATDWSDEPLTLV